MRNTLGFLFVGALLAAPMFGCGGDSTADAVDLATPDLVAVNPCGIGSLCTQSTIPDQSLVLFDAAQVQFSIVGAPDYSGKVTLTTDRSKISGMSGGIDPYVGIAVVPSEFQMTAGAAKKIDIKLSTTTDAAAFDNQTIVIHVADSADPTKSFDIPFKLTVKPILNVTFAGAGAAGSLHTWSTDSLATPTMIPIRIRTSGTTFNFTNKDAAMGTHAIHGNAPVKHQADPGTVPNGTYSLTGVNGAGTQGAFYCHNHGSGAGSNVIAGDRNLVFVQ